MEIGNIKLKKMITHIKNSMWMYPSEAHVSEREFEGWGVNGCSTSMPKGIYVTLNELMQMLRALQQW